jgi:hypothetical protein
MDRQRLKKIMQDYLYYEDVTGGRVRAQRRKKEKRGASHQLVKACLK